MSSTARQESSRKVQAAFFNVGDLVTFGKYQNKHAQIVAFHDDGKGNPLVELEPIPKGRKKNKVIALFKIRHSVNIQKVASRIVFRYAVRQARMRLAADDMNAILMKVRKGVMTPLESIGKLTKVLEYLGGWKVEPTVGVVGLRHSTLFTGDEPEVLAVTAFVRKHEVSSLPASPKVDELYVMDIDLTKPHQGFGLRFKLWVGAAGYRITAPDGKEFDILPDPAVFSQRIQRGDPRWMPKLGPRNSKFNSVRKCFPWLEKETGFKQQVLDALGMGAHVKAPERTKENTGSCPCCFRNIKLKKASGAALPTMVSHGYRRPGWGAQVGNCMGVGWPPFELSPAGTKHLVQELEKKLATHETYLGRLNGAQVTSLSIDKHNTQITPDDPRWAQYLKSTRVQTERTITWISEDIKGLVKLITHWKEEPLPLAGIAVKNWQLKDRA